MSVLSCLHGPASVILRPDIGHPPAAIFDRQRFYAVSTAGDVHWLRSTDTTEYVLPSTRTKFVERGVCYLGPAAWSSLPSDPGLRDTTDTNTFETAQERTY